MRGLLGNRQSYRDGRKIYYGNINSDMGLNQMSGAEERIKNVLEKCITEGQSHLRCAAFNDAYESYKQAYLISPNNPYIIRHIADVYTALGKLELAQRWYKELKELED